MRLKLIGTAAAALALALPGLAHAATWRVEPGGGACGTAGDLTCGTLGQAEEAVGNGDTIDVAPGTYTESVDFDEVATITLRGVGPGMARINGRLTFTGTGTDPQSLTIQRLAVFAPSGVNALRIFSGTVSGDKTVSIQSSILSGNGANAALHADTDVALNTIAITARHVTLADAGAAPAVTEEGDDAAITATFQDSIVLGTTADDVTGNNIESGSATLFVNQPGEDFHLRRDSPAVNQGGTGAGEQPEDIDGETRSGAWDQGGDEYVNYEPTKATLSSSATTVQRGTPVSFTASATDPNQAQGDSVAGYQWTFGDGTTTQTSEATTSHTYATAGSYPVTVRAVDQSGAVGQASEPITITVTDPPPTGPGGVPVRPFTIDQLPGFDAGIAPGRRGPDTEPPQIAFANPRANQTVRLGRRPVVLRGRNADVSGVRRVELALMRREGARCRWYDGRGAFRLGSCTQPSWFKGTVDDFDWYFAFPRRVRPRPGAYVGFARATDYVGNRTSRFDAANAISFRWAR